MFFRHSLTIFTLALAIACPGAFAQSEQTPEFLRGSIFDAQAARTGIESLLLYSIALVESGASRGRGLVAPSPYAIRVNERSLNRAYYPSDRAEAQALLAELLEAGYTNIDVGLMQINLRWHGHRVKEPANLLDPAENISIGTDILYDAMLSSPSDVLTAVGRYHSWRPELGRPYAERVIRIYRSLKRG